MQLSNRKIRFYNSDQEFDSTYVYVWVPANTTLSYFIDFMNQYAADNSLEIEESLKGYLSEEQKGGLHFFVGERAADKSAKRRKIILYAQSDTLADSCKIIYEHLKDTHHCILVYPTYVDEGAQKFFEDNNLDSKELSKVLLKAEKPDLFLMLNDWSKEAKRVVSLCRKLQIPTICLQESIIDFGDPKTNRMKFTDHVFVQGIQTILDLDRDHYYISGNPRYEVVQTASYTGKKEMALINCNFTYGIFEEIRDSWLADITEALGNHQIDFRISQHPRDKGDLSIYQEKVISSSSATVAQQITESDILITRFSSLIHESILQRKIVIYYNSHGEGMQYDFRFNDSFLFLCKTKEELKAVIGKIKSNTAEIPEEEWEKYITSHCLPSTGSASENINQIISTVDFKAGKFESTDRFRLMFYNKLILKPMRAVLGLFR